MKHKLFGWLFLIITGAFLFIILRPKSEDIPASGFNPINVESIVIYNLKDTSDIRLTNRSSIEQVISSLNKSQKGNYLNSKGGYYSYDFDVNLKSGEKEHFRIYYNKRTGKYISGENFYYKNDSLDVLISNLKK